MIKIINKLIEEQNDKIDMLDKSLGKLTDSFNNDDLKQKRENQFKAKAILLNIKICRDKIFNYRDTKRLI